MTNTGSAIMQKMITIAIPVYERDIFFRNALESAIKQTLPVNIMVVDNASTKCDFKAIVAEYDYAPVHYHRNPENLGAHGNFNQCIKLCPTPYVLILHDDDLLELDYIEKLSECFDPQIDFFWCKVAVIDQQGRIKKEEAVDYSRFQQIEPWCTHNGAYQGVVIRCTKAIELGMFDPSVRYFPDWNLYVEFMLNAKTRFLPFRGVYYRTGELGATAGLARHYRYHAYVRNQIKRNFSHAGLWSRYRALRFTQQMPCPSLGQLIQWSPQLSRSRLVYFWKLYFRSEPFSFRQRLTKWIVRLAGWRSIRLAAACHRGDAKACRDRLTQ
jgi:glycosyltransferase involved in cell wall biosynthesis